jgi:hypothetical protein
LDYISFFNKQSGMNLEVRTIRAMLVMYCRASHSSAGELCADCAELFAYARERIAKCPFGIEKPVCNRCTVHCYKPAMREEIQRVMRYAGPRMLRRHPLLAIRHLIRARRYLSGCSK